MTFTSNRLFPPSSYLSPTLRNSSPLPSPQLSSPLENGLEWEVTLEITVQSLPSP